MAVAVVVDLEGNCWDIVADLVDNLDFVLLVVDQVDKNLENFVVLHRALVVDFVVVEIVVVVGQVDNY
jgi:hypothetical protein